MPVTPSHGLPYPTPDDPVALGAADIRALAEAVDALRGILAVIDATTIGTPEHLQAGKGFFLDRANGGFGINFGTGGHVLFYPAAGPLRFQGQIQADSGFKLPGYATVITGQQLGQIAGIPGGVASIGVTIDGTLYAIPVCYAPALERPAPEDLPPVGPVDLPAFEPPPE